MKEKALVSLHRNARDYGIELSQHHLNLFSIYLDELMIWNRRMNLTGLSTRERIVNELFLDSLIPASHLPKEGRMLDVGSGAGFPGIPLKVLNPGLTTHLLESRSKRVNFLKQVVRLLRLDDIDVIRGRIELSGERLHPDGYPVITARAFAGPDQMIKVCSSFLEPRGMLVCFFGSRWITDLEKCSKTIETAALSIIKVVPYSLPGKQTVRHSVILQKK